MIPSFEYKLIISICFKDYRILLTLSLQNRILMNEQNQSQLSSEDKRLLNILEIKMYDVSQNVEIISKQMTNNQIKDSVAQTYNIFCQLKQIFEKLGASFLYQILRKMQVNSVILSSILTERLDKINDQFIRTRAEKVIRKSKLNQVIKLQKPQQNNAPITKIPRLGGINLYNEQFIRGLECYQINDNQSIEALAGKCRIKQSKKMKENILRQVTKQLMDKTDIQNANVSDQINNYIKQYKQNGKIHNSVSYQKQLIEIIDFFKSSQLDAISFLSKSPNTNSEYTEDYINRIDNLEKDIKMKAKQQKNTIVERMREFILKLKQKIFEMGQSFQEKNKRLMLYQKGLIKSTNVISTQTYDHYESRMRQLESVIRQQEERYLMITQFKNKSGEFESLYYQLDNKLQMKNNEVSKIKKYTLELQDLVEYLKKILRENKEKINISMKDLDKMMYKKKREIFSKRNVDSKQPTKQILNEDFSIGEYKRKISKNQKKTKRFQKLANPSPYRVSLEKEFSSSFIQNGTYINMGNQDQQNWPILNQPIQNDWHGRQSIRTEEQQNIDKINTNSSHQKKPHQQKQYKQAKKHKQSNSRNDLRKNTKTKEQSRQVSFQKSGFQDTIIQHTNKRTTNKQTNNIFEAMQKANIKQHILETQQQDDISPNQYEENRKSKKNILKQKISSGKSFNNLETYENRPTSVSISKKYLSNEIIRENNKIATMIKSNKMKIVANISMTIQATNHKESSRIERASLPSQVQPKRNLNQKHSMQNNNKNSIKSKNFNSTSDCLPVGNKFEKELVNIDRSFRNNSKNITLSKEPNLTHEDEKNANLDKKLKKGKLSTLKHKIKTEGSQNVDCREQKNFDDRKLYIISQDKWRVKSNQSSDSSNTIVGYILNEIQKENLNLDQFKQIATIIQNQPSQAVHKLKQISNQSEKTTNKNHVVQLSFCQINGKCSIHHTNLTKIQSPLAKQHHKENDKPKVQKISIRQQPPNIFSITGIAFEKIQDLHYHRSKCNTKDNVLCEHMTKYFNILKTLNKINTKQKKSLHIHIQSIGQAIQKSKLEIKYSNLPTRGQSISMMQKPNKISYLKQQMATLDSQQSQKSRFLPIICATNSQFYKTKSRHNLYK